jgi:hypothetical protein
VAVLDELALFAPSCCSKIASVAAFYLWVSVALQHGLQIKVAMETPM